MPDTSPTFLVGAERSGSTMVRLMLSHHPEVCWCNEFEYTVDPLALSPSEWPDVDEYEEWLETHRIFQDTGFVLDRSLPYPELVNSFLLQKMEQTGKKIVGATVHREFDQLLRVWPEARFIHLLRDGRDVARSCIRMGWAGNVWTGVRFWSEVEELWARMLPRIPPDRRTDISYETLVTDPEEALRPACRLIGVEYHPAMLEYPETTTYGAPDPGLAFQWRRKATQKEIRLLEAEIGDMLLERGYELSGDTPKRPGALERVALRVQDRWASHRFRQRRFGFRLWATDLLSRRLGLRGTQRRVQLRINDIVRSQLK